MMRVGLLIPLTNNVRQCIASAADLGFHSGQLSIWDLTLYCSEKVDEIKLACVDFDFTVTALWCGWSGPVDWSYPGMYSTIGLIPTYMRERRMNELIDGIEFANKIGVNSIITHIGYLPDNPLDPNHLEIVRILKHIGSISNKNGQKFLFETGEELPLTLVQLIQEVGTGNLGVNFDPANYLINARANPSDALDMLLPYVGGVHAKDAVYPVGIHPKGKEMPIGQGKVDFHILLAKLAKCGFGGDITIERETPDGEERTSDILNSKIYLEDIIMGFESI